MKRSVPVLLVLLLVAPLSVVGVRAQTPAADPLLADSLKALSELVTAQNCGLRDAADGDITDNVELPYVFCDDGVPPEGGGSKSIPVPVKYAANASGDDWTGLPGPATVDQVTQADATDDLQPERDNRISLDVDITLPPSVPAETLIGADMKTIRPPKGGYPVIVFMHGCCGGNKNSWEASNIDAANELWHHSNAMFASRGYVVINYTARGFRNANEEGSTGTTQLDSRRYEINDYQYLAGLLADHDATTGALGEVELFQINPKKIGVVGGSYGGGFSWMALTDPTWKSPVTKRKMRVGAAVPKYGWTDLVEALVPSGHYFDRDPKTGATWIASTDPKTAVSRNPLGVMKQSIVAGLFATGNNTSGNHTTFPDYIDSAFARLQVGEPYDGDATLEQVTDTFLNDRSAYYQQRFWDRVAKGMVVPMFVPATWTDPLFPTMESVRFYNKLRSLNKKYPITMYLGDYQHFVANKAKEWGDVCGNDHHVCTVEDFRSSTGVLRFGRTPNRVRMGINTRIHKFLDYYLRRKGVKPLKNVSATTTVCAANSTDALKVDEPGIEYRAPSWRGLSPTRKELKWAGGGPVFGTSSSTAVDTHATDSDPVARQTQSNKCYTTSQGTAPGVIRFEHEALKEPFTMMGVPQWSMKYSTTAQNYWVAARMFDVAPNGSSTLVTRGVCRVSTAANPERLCDVFDLWGNGWRFEKDHKIAIEITQADTPTFRRNNMQSTIAVEEAKLLVPVAPESRNVDFRN